MKKWIYAVFAAVIMLVTAILLSENTFEPIDLLMKPPKIEGQNAEIQVAFENSLNDKYILRSPLSGEHKSSFILIDIDKDKDEEVIVFYSPSATPDVVHMNILDKVDNKWNSIADLESAHKEVHRVEFSDINKDGNKEIVVGWSIFDSELSNTLNIYTIKSADGKKIIEKVFDGTYVEYTVCDINSDKNDDILLFSKAPDDKMSIKGTFYDFTGSEAEEKGVFFIDPVISSVYSVCSDKDTFNDSVRIYVDGYRFDSGMTTDLFYWDNENEAFYRPTFSSEKSLAVAATRSSPIVCKDIDKDNTVEIPFEEHIKDSEVISFSKNYSRQQNVIKWTRCDRRGFKTVLYEIPNSKFGYSLKIKNEWYGNFTVKNETDKGLITFYSSGHAEEFNNHNNRYQFFDDEETSGKLNALFSLLATRENGSEFYDLTGYKYIKSDNGFNYFCKIFDYGKKSGITKESVKKILFTEGDG